MLALGVLLTDVALAAAGILVGALGVVAVVGLGNIVVNALGQLF